MDSDLRIVTSEGSISKNQHKLMLWRYYPESVVLPHCAVPVNFKPSPNRSILQNTSAGGGEAMVVPLLRPVRVLRRRRSVSSISMKIHEGEVEFRSQHAFFPVGAAWIS